MEQQLVQRFSMGGERGKMDMKKIFIEVMLDISFKKK